MVYKLADLATWAFAQMSGVVQVNRDCVYPVRNRADLGSSDDRLLLSHICLRLHFGTAKVRIGIVKTNAFYAVPHIARTARRVIGEIKTSHQTYGPGVFSRVRNQHHAERENKCKCEYRFHCCSFLTHARADSFLLPNPCLSWRAVVLSLPITAPARIYSLSSGAVFDSVEATILTIFSRSCGSSLTD